ncbi:MAG: hypothetical protein ACYTGB_16635 [Planctomycetota bacterium]|jgi:hypothetical protein
MAIGDRSHTDGHLEADGMGVGVDYEVDGGEFFLDMHASLWYMPARQSESGGRVNLYGLDGLLLWRQPLAGFDTSTYHVEYTSLLHARIGLGPSLVLMDFRNDCGAALGSSLGKHLRLEVFGDAHGWLGSDGEDFRAAWVASLGVTLAVSF